MIRNLRIIVDISKTHLLAKKKQTIVAALGVTFGVSMYIIMMSFMTGLNDLLDGLILNRTPHVQIFNKSEPSPVQPLDLWSNQIHFIQSIKPKAIQERVKNALPMMSELRQMKTVKGVTPQVTCQIFYKAGTSNLNGVLNGIEVDEEIRLFNFKDYIVNGDPLELLRLKNSILLGAGIAKNLSLEVGDKIQVMNTNGTVFNLTIAGIFQSGLAEVDDIQSYVNLKMAQQIRGVGSNFISRIHIKLHDINQAVPLSKTIENIHQVKALDIKTANAQFETGSSVRTLISYSVSIALMIVAGFGIYNILNMFIYEKMNDIAILKATGFTGADVMSIFLFQALLIGLIGGLIGISIGYGGSLLIDNTPFVTEALPTIKTYPVNYNPVFYFSSIGFALLFTFLAGYLPALKAKKIDPVDIIRGR
jgi:lipoprotein-releasing system permease protein